MARARRRDGGQETILLQACPGQPIVAALVGRQALGQRHVFDAFDSPDPGS
jgi:hypothetical protein